MRRGIHHDLLPVAQKVKQRIEEHEVARVPQLELRLREAAKAGFKRALVPARAAKDLPKTIGLSVAGVSNLREAAEAAFGVE